MKYISCSGAFSDFHDSGFIYIDKTEKIYELLKRQKKIFISRPRRFGKSLTLDTIGTLFEFGVEPYFQGTWIYDKWNEPTCPVLRLNFLRYDISSVDKFKAELNTTIKSFAKKYKFNDYLESENPNETIGNLLDVLRSAQKNIVILIDEYDCQLTANINNKELYEEFRLFLRSFYATLKDQNAIRFMAVTGVTRLKDITIFSVGSDIKDLTNNSAYSQLIGFTRDEIKKFYIDYLRLAASYENNCKLEEVTNSQIEGMLDKLSENYDGYCFDEDYEKKVFSTWSVNNFFENISSKKKVQFGDYWYENGGLPSILVNYLQTHELNIFDYIEKEKLITVSDNDFFNPTSLLDINPSVLMCQTGYLTLRSAIDSANIYLGIPNGEVYKALGKVLATKFFNKRIQMSNSQGQNVLDIGSIDEIMQLINTYFNTVPYDNYPINSEASVQAFMQLLLLGDKQNVITERHQARGRSDLMVETNKRRIVFELKYAQNETQAKDKLNEAIAQIKERDYGNIVPKKEELLRIAAVFNADPKVRQFSLYQRY